MSEKKIVFINIVASLLLQITTIASGFILPKIILSYFGSETNGLIASITQFLNYITLLEGGLTGVVKAALYKPLADKDYTKVSAVLKAANNFYRKIGLFFILYAVIVALVYPLFVKSTFSYSYVFSLTLIIGLSLFIQYYFSLTLRILLDADRKVFIGAIGQILFSLINLFLILLATWIYPSIHVIKFVTALAFCLQPLIYKYYIVKNYKLDYDAQPDKVALKQRWDGFGQNIAYFIHTNTAIAVLTLFATLKDVSIYAVYVMIIFSLKKLIMAISSAVVPSIGNKIVTLTKKQIQDIFNVYEFGIYYISTLLFSCCAVLIVPFVMLYTSGIADADYKQPLFAIMMVIAEMIYCMRDPYVSVAYSVGHFRQTASYAYIEACINIFLSVVLVFKYGLVGVAVGVLISMLYRTIAHVWYIKDKIIYRSPLLYFRTVALFLMTGLVSVGISYTLLSKSIDTYYVWLVNAIETFFTSLIVINLMSYIFFKREFMKCVGDKIASRIRRMDS